MIDKDEKETLLNQIEALGTDEIHPREAENHLMPILQALLGIEGFSVEYTHGPGDQGIDFLAEKNGYKIGIQQKHYTNKKRKVGVDVIQQMLGAALLNPLDKVIIVSNTLFSKSAREIISRQLPIEIELLDIDSLKAWGARLKIINQSLQQEAINLISQLSRKLASLIAKDPSVLEVIEWRDVERIVAEIFDEMGFKVKLTPPSKDGGKDVILECQTNGKEASYIVEIKHWRSGQRVGSTSVRDFLRVILREKREGGVFLSTYGYCDNAFELLSEIDRERIKFGNKSKIISMCKRYSKIRSGIWMPDSNLSEILYEETE